MLLFSSQERRLTNYFFPHAQHLDRQRTNRVRIQKTSWFSPIREETEDVREFQGPVVNFCKAGFIGFMIQ